MLPHPYEIFRLIFSDPVLDRIVASINEYARLKNCQTHSEHPHESARQWKSTTRGEMLFFIATHVYMGVVALGDKRDYFADGISTLFPDINYSAECHENDGNK